MKGEYVEESQQQQRHHHHHQQYPISISSSSSQTITNSNPQNANNTHQIFPKFLSPPPHFIPQHHQNQQFTHHQQQQQYPTQDNTEITPLNQALITTPPTKKPKTATPTTSEDGATIEVSRRPRGRPPGSKNRPKPPIIITREPEPTMSPYILELPAGSDLLESLTRFTRRRGVGICVLTASGSVANVSLKQPSTSGGPPAGGGTVTFHGQYEILSLSACIMANTVPFNVNNGGGVSISLAGPRGQIIGGKVVGSLICAGIVYVIATSFNSPTFCRLPLEDQQRNNNNNHNVVEEMGDDRVTGGDGSGGGGGQGNSSSPVSGDCDGSVGGGGGHMGMYNVHHHNSGGGDVLWALTPARPQQQQQQQQQTAPY